MNTKTQNHSAREGIGGFSDAKSTEYSPDFSDHSDNGQEYELEEQPILSNRQLELAYKYKSEGQSLDLLLADPDFLAGCSSGAIRWFQDFVALWSYGQDGVQHIEYFILNSCQRMVAYHARRYQNSGLSFDELVQAGNIGLLKAVTDFPYDPAPEFVSYAHACVKNGIKMTIMKEAGPISLPWYLNSALSQLRSNINTFRQEQQREPSSDEVRALSEQLDLSRLPTTHALVFEAYRLSIVSLDKPLTAARTEHSLQDTLASSHNDPAEMSSYLRKGDLDALLNQLTSRQRQVLTMRYGLDDNPPLMAKEVSKTLGISDITEYRIARDALAALRTMIEANPQLYLRPQSHKSSDTPKNGDSLTIEERANILSNLPHEIGKSGRAKRLTTEECKVLDTHTEALWNEAPSLSNTVVARRLQLPKTLIIASRRRLVRCGKMPH